VQATVKFDFQLGLNTTEGHHLSHNRKKEFSLHQYGFDASEICSLSDCFNEGFLNCGCGYNGTTWWHAIAGLTKENQYHVYNIVGCPHCEQLKFLLVN
jgi:hypothetical protein